MFILAFFEGIITALGALVLELATLAIFNLPSADSSLLVLFICVTIEEILKYAVIYNHYLKSKSAGKIIYSALFIGLGFSLTELFTKQLNAQQILTFPALGIFFVHIITSGIVGFFLWKKQRQSRLAALLLLTLNIALHFCYNFFILQY